MSERAGDEVPHPRAKEKPYGRGANWVALALVLSTPVLCCFFNPVLLMFLKTVTVVNETPYAVHAVPVSRDEGGEVRRAFLVHRMWLAIPVPTDLLVPGNASTSFVYDWDDDNLCWLAVRGHDGPWKVVQGPMSSKPVCALVEHSDAGCCGTAKDFAFTVGSLEHLADAPDWMLRAASLAPDAGR